ncbi:MAG: hypothetical protein JNL12_14675 [Planctomycetes bacterium]|nr:hypothetical protein [Planctomycetota bacterium]
MNTLGHHTSTPPPTLATRILQILPAGVSVTSMASLSYYHLQRMQGPVAPKSLLQHWYIALYESVGFAPSLLFFLLVTVWSVLWFATGQLERPLGRLGRLVAMAVLLGVALNLGAGSVAPGPQKGELGAWLGSVLVGMVGYYPSLLLVWAATLGALLLATDFFFADSFERLWRARSSASDEAGVEAGVTEHLRQLGSSLRPTPAASTDEAVARPAESLPSSASFAAAVAAAAAAAEAQERQSPEAETVDEAYRGDERPTSPSAPLERADEERPLSYLERRRLREARRYARFEPADEPVAEPTTPAAQRRDEFEASVASPLSPTPPEAPASSWPAVTAPADSSDEARSDEARSDGTPLDSELLAVASALASEELPAIADASPVGDEVEVEQFDLDEDEVDQDDETDGASSEGAADPSERPTRFAEGEPSLDRSLDEAQRPWAGEPPYVLPAASVEPLEQSERADPAVVQPVEPPVTIPRSEPRPPVVEADGERASGRQQSLFAQGLEEGLVQEAVDLVVGARRATAGFLQRKLRIDYQLALDLLAELAARGVVALEGDATQGRVVV